jgi:hypothetical protein
LSVRIRNASLGFRARRSGKKGCPEFIRIGLPNSGRGKHPRLVSAARMLWVQAVRLQPTAVDNGTLAIGQFRPVPSFPGSVFALSELARSAAVAKRLAE